MDEVRKTVRRAQWWLAADRFLHALGWTTFLAFALAAAVAVVDHYRPLNVSRWAIAASAMAGGLLLAIAWAIVRRRGPLDAAMEVDRRFQLKERVASVLSLSPEEQATAAGAALADDAADRVRGLDLGEQFSVRPRWSLLLPAFPAAALFAVALLPVPDAEAQPDEVAAAVDVEQVERVRQGLEMKLAEARQQAQAEGLAQADELLAKLEKELSRPEAAAEKSDPLARLHDLAEAIEKRRAQTPGGDLQRQLEQLRDLKSGPADDLIAALAAGDAKKVAKAVEALKQSLGKLDEAQKQALSRQLRQIAKRLQNEGQKGELGKLAEQLLDAAEKLDADDLKQLAQSLGDLGDELESLAQQLQESQLLDRAAEDLAQARRQMLCDQCGGKGCPACGKDGKQPGDGLGEGRGQGDRPEAKDDVAFKGAKAPSKLGKGASVRIESPEASTAAGEVRQKLLREIEAAKAAGANPLGQQPMTPRQRRHAQEYLDGFGR